MTIPGADEHITIPPPSLEMKKDDAFKEAEKEFDAEMFSNERLDRNKPKIPEAENPEITFPEEKKEEPKPEDKAAEQPADKPAEKPPEEKPAETPAAADDTDALLSGGEKKPEEKPAPKAEEKPAAQLVDHDLLAEKVAAKLKPKEAPAPDPLANFTDEDKAQLRILQHLQKNNEKYKGRDLVKETAEFWNRETNYILAWEKANPGETFDKDAKDHEAFYSKHEPKVEPDDLEDAQIDLKVEEKATKLADKIVRERLAPVEEQVRNNNRKQAEVEVAKVVEEGVEAAVVNLASEAVPEFKEVLKDGRMSPEAVAAMKEKDTAAVQAINREARYLRVYVREIERMANLGEHFNYNPNLREEVGGEVIRPHVEIAQVLNDLEVSISKGPEEGKVRVIDGIQKRWASREAVDRLFEKHKDNPDMIARIDRSFWQVGVDDVKREFVRRSATKVKDVLEIANTRGAASSSGRTGNSTNTGDDKANGKPARSAPINPPSTASSSDMTQTRIPKPPANDSAEKVIEKSFFG